MSAPVPHRGENDRRATSAGRGRGGGRGPGRGPAAHRGPGRDQGHGCGRGERRRDGLGRGNGRGIGVGLARGVGLAPAADAPPLGRSAAPVELVHSPSPSDTAAAQSALPTIPTKRLHARKAPASKAPASEMVAIVSSPDDCLLCGACETSCPTGAITARDRLLVDESLCSGCGTCVDLCEREVLSLARR